MAWEPKPGSFSLFRNVKKLDGDRQPDYRGDGLDNAGNPIEVAAWIKEGAKGKFMSCTFKLKEVKPTQYAQPRSVPDDDSDIPF